MTTAVTTSSAYVDLALELLDRAKRDGATDAEVMVVDGETLSVQVRMSAVDRLTKAREKRLGLRVFIGKRSATTSTSDFSKASLTQLTADTCALARAVVEDEVSGLAEADQFAQEIPDLDLYDETRLTTEQQIELARTAERTALSADPRITNSEGAEFDWSTGSIVLANSRGFSGQYRASNYSLSVAPVARDPETGAMQRDSWYAVQRTYAKLESPESIGLEAARRTVRRLGAKKVTTQRVPVVFDQEMAAGFLSQLCSALSGYALYKGASYLVGQLGQRIAPDSVTIYDDGRMVGGLGSKPFDGDGLPTRRTVVVERGLLKSYLLDTYSGRKLGLPSTGNASRSVGDAPGVGPMNFYLSPGTKSAEQILAGVKEGLYVTELIGFGVNMVTGDYSRGAVGFWIKDGELAFPVEEITIAGNLKDMWMNIEEIGNDLRFRGRIASPTMKLHEMTVAGS